MEMAFHPALHLALREVEAQGRKVAGVAAPSEVAPRAHLDWPCGLRAVEIDEGGRAFDLDRVVALASDVLDVRAERDFQGLVGLEERGALRGSRAFRELRRGRHPVDLGHAGRGQGEKESERDGVAVHGNPP
jgi:hypothetical protein